MEFSSSKVEKVLVFWEMKFSIPKIKNVLILIFSQKKGFYYTSGNGTFF